MKSKIFFKMNKIKQHRNRLVNMGNKLCYQREKWLVVAEHTKSVQKIKRDKIPVINNPWDVMCSTGNRVNNSVITLYDDK